jgi:hypothetical protein
MQGESTFLSGHTPISIGVWFVNNEGATPNHTKEGHDNSDDLATASDAGKFRASMTGRSG